VQVYAVEHDIGVKFAHTRTGDVPVSLPADAGAWKYPPRMQTDGIRQGMPALDFHEKYPRLRSHGLSPYPDSFAL
jgi:hypothetical protein